jgi:hypothetical protein
MFYSGHMTFNFTLAHIPGVLISLELATSGTGSALSWSHLVHSAWCLRAPFIALLLGCLRATPLLGVHTAWEGAPSHSAWCLRALFIARYACVHPIVWCAWLQREPFLHAIG